MKVSYETIGNFESTVDWLKNVFEKDPEGTLGVIGEKGVEALQHNTPIGKTGETALGWSYEIVKEDGGLSLIFNNTAHPEEVVNVALLLSLGHATKNGGYVHPNPYIQDALNSIFETAGDEIMKEEVNK